MKVWLPWKKAQYFSLKAAHGDQALQRNDEERLPPTDGVYLFVTGRYGNNERYGLFVVCDERSVFFLCKANTLTCEQVESPAGKLLTEDELETGIFAETGFHDPESAGRFVCM